MTKRIVIILLAIFPFIGFSQEAYFERNIPWAKVLKMAKDQNKPIFVDAYTDWCYWCKVMDKETFTDENVAATLNQKFIAVKIDAENGEGINFAAKFKISAYPTVLFFNANGDLLKNEAGYLDVENFNLKSEEVFANLNPKNAISGRNLNPGFPEFYLNSFNPKNKEKTEPNEVTDFLNSQKDLKSEIAWAVMYRFSLNDEFTQLFLDMRDELKSIYGDYEVNSKIQDIASNKLGNAIKNKDEGQLNETIDFAKSYFEEENKSDYINSFRYSFYIKTENWKTFAKYFNEKYEDAHPNQINAYSWDIYEKCADIDVLNSACGWMQLAVKKEPSYALMDTYAALLFRSGQPEEAKKWAKRAIEQGTEDGEDVEGTKKLLEKFK